MGHSQGIFVKLDGAKMLPCRRNSHIIILVRFSLPLSLTCVPEVSVYVRAIAILHMHSTNKIIIIISDFNYIIQKLQIVTHQTCSRSPLGLSFFRTANSDNATFANRHLGSEHDRSIHFCGRKIFPRSWAHINFPNIDSNEWMEARRAHTKLHKCRVSHAVGHVRSLAELTVSPISTDAMAIKFMCFDITMQRVACVENTHA